MGQDLEYYAYLSEHTIRRMYEGIPRTRFPWLRAELSLNLPFLTLKGTQSDQNGVAVTEQLRQVISYLERHHPDQIGSIDDPKKYIRGTLPMFTYFLPQGFGADPNKPPDLVYYGGSTAQTILGLGGAASYVLGTPESRRMQLISSSLPYLVHILARESRVNTAMGRASTSQRHDEGQALATIAYMEEYNRPATQLQNMTFLAKLKLDSQKIKGYLWTGQRILLASPLYVAYAD